MKKIILTLAAFITLCTTTNAQQLSCCAKNSTTAFASLGTDKSFVASHLAPLPFSFVPDKGKMITITSPDNKDATAYFVKVNDAKKTLIVFHEWWGLNDYIKQEAEKWATELGVNVIAPDLYDNKSANTADEATLLMQALKDDRARAIISGCIDFCGPENKLQTIGWCMGGGWSMQTALMAGNHAKGCVVYYGMPETDVTKLSKLKCPILGIFATQDKWITPELVKQFETDMNNTNQKLTVINFDADHAFANPSNPKYNVKATADAHTKAAAFLKAGFK